MIFINTCDVSKEISKDSEYNSCFKHFDELKKNLSLSSPQLALLDTVYLRNNVSDRFRLT